MLKNISAKALSTMVLILIVVYGFFKNWVATAFANLLIYTLDHFGIDGYKINILLNEFRQSSSHKDYILGWLIYYPTYLFLHVVFIFLLFNKQIKTRNYLTIALIGLTTISLGLAVTGKIFELELLYDISYDAFQKLFGLPFILLFIEGGRIFYNDIFAEKV